MSEFYYFIKDGKKSTDYRYLHICLNYANQRDGEATIYSESRGTLGWTSSYIGMGNGKRVRTLFVKQPVNLTISETASIEMVRDVEDVVVDNYAERSAQ